MLVKEEEEKQLQEVSANRRLFVMPTRTLSTLAHLCNDTRPAIPILQPQGRLALDFFNNNLGNFDASGYAFTTTHCVSKAWDRTNRPMHSCPALAKTTTSTLNSNSMAVLRAHL